MDNIIVYDKGDTIYVLSDAKSREKFNAIDFEIRNNFKVHVYASQEHSAGRYTVVHRNDHSMLYGKGVPVYNVAEKWDISVYPWMIDDERSCRSILEPMSDEDLESLLVV